MGEKSLDSFLDVVCNLVAGLFLIALTTALGAGKTVFDVTVPIERYSQGARPLGFVVVPSGVYPIDLAEVESQFMELRESGDEVMGAESEFFQWARSPGDYLLALRLIDGPPPIGEDTLDKIANACEKPERDGYFAYFYVAPDDEAFRLLRLARKALWEKDIEVGWIPADARKGLVFGAGGRLVQPQN